MKLFDIWALGYKAVDERYARRVLEVRGKEIDRAHRLGLVERKVLGGRRFLILTRPGFVAAAA